MRKFLLEKWCDTTYLSSNEISLCQPFSFGVPLILANNCWTRQFLCPLIVGLTLKYASFFVSENKILLSPYLYAVAPGNLTNWSSKSCVVRFENYHFFFRCLPRPANDANGCCHWRLSGHQLQPSPRHRRQWDSLPNSRRTNCWSETATALRYTSGKFIEDPVSLDDKFRL